MVTEMGRNCVVSRPETPYRQGHGANPKELKQHGF
jgi:hypothetical protein